MPFVRTLKLKVQADDYAWLNAAAREVNAVFNFCNETSARQAERWRMGENRPILSGFDLCTLTAGYTEFTDYIGADTIQRVCTEYAVKRKAARKPRLQWRVSNPDSPRYSLGYVPFKAASISLTDTGVKFAGKRFRVFELERLAELPQPEKGRPWRDGCFAQDAAGDWWLCLPVLQPDVPAVDLPGVVGIDLGLKDVAVDSDGWRVPAPQFYRQAEEELAKLQRPPPGRKKAGKRSRRGQKLTKLHRKVARQRKDFTHKASARAVRRALKRGNGRILIGDVSASGLAQTKMAKSVLDACWTALRTQLQYKGQQAGICVHVVSERLSTQECPDCHALTGPRGREGLAIREWTCSACGVVHDRDVASARVIGSRVDLATALEAGGCQGAEPPRPGVRRSRRSAVNQHRPSVSGNRAPGPVRVQPASPSRCASRASETGTDGC